MAVKNKTSKYISYYLNGKKVTRKPTNSLLIGEIYGFYTNSKTKRKNKYKELHYES